MTDVKSFVRGLESELEKAPSQQQWNIAKRKIECLSNSSERSEAFRLLKLRGEFPRASASDDPIVIMVHGIRTHAFWQEELKDKFQDEHDVQSYPIGYGKFSTFEFWCPLFTRKRAINEILRKIRTIQDSHSDRPICLIAHSFGTYAVVQGLWEDPTIKVERLLLCGGVVRRAFRWDRLANRPTTILNDCGRKDIWPLVACWTTFGYGATGRNGFKTPEVIDRFHEIAHSSYFEISFIEKFWVPFIKYGEVVPVAR